MDDVELDLKNRRTWVWKDGKQELWTEENGQLSWAKPRPKLKGSNTKEEEEGQGGGEEKVQD
jgi:hypothetical protein